MIKYQPNFNNVRVLKTVRLAYGYTKGVFSPTEPQQRSQQAIDKRFGQSQGDLSKWLKSILLICTDHHYSAVAGISKKYILNVTGAAYIESVLKGNLDKAFTPDEQIELKQKQIKEPTRYFDHFVVSKMVEAEHANELNCKVFVYTDKSNRLWHPLQNIKREYKTEILNNHGLKYHYDIRCCAPTLILQHAQHQGMDEYLFGLQSYLADRTSHRDRITNEAELYEAKGYSSKTSKILINALFCGARLGNSPEFALSKLMNHDSNRIEWLKQDEWLTTLRSDIKECWTAIKPTMSRRSITDKNGNNKMLPISSKQKWARYFDLERQVLNAANDYFSKTNNKCFLEHDGWSTEMMVDEVALKAHIMNKTGFKIEIDAEHVCEIVGDANASPVSVSHFGFVNSSSLTDTLTSATPKEVKLSHQHNTPPHTHLPHVYNFGKVGQESQTLITQLTWMQQHFKNKQANDYNIMVQ
jgi:hypothetical protein